MTTLKELLKPGNVLLGLAVQTKKRIFDHASQLFATLYPLNPKDVFESLMVRERLGSTYLGEGLSIPHGRMHGLHGVKAIFIRSQEPITMGPGKDELSKNFFFLLADQDEPTEHLKILAQISEIFSDPAERKKLNEATSPEEFCKCICEWCDAHPSED